jgi:hypothetical protein
VNKKESEKNRVALEIESQDPYLMFLFAMRSPKTRDKCTGRLRMFFDFLGIPGVNQ